MGDAWIASTARTPIDSAFEGTLVDVHAFAPPISSTAAAAASATPSP